MNESAMIVCLRIHKRSALHQHRLLEKALPASRGDCTQHMQLTLTPRDTECSRPMAARLLVFRVRSNSLMLLRW